MRVVAGALKGRRLDAPSWPGLRPTSDKLRETLFNILAPRIEGARVLDGYAGTGALGIEALSRGARTVVFVERDRRAQALIERNLARCGIANGYAIIRATVSRALETLRGEAPFGIVLLDPPYDSAPSARAAARNDGRAHSETLDAVLAAAGNVMAPGALLVLEHARRRDAPATAARLVRSREVMSGDSALAFYELGR
jgi:16S rRNA (guanine(966)-N(2))-methyltransferase RsmD